MGEGLERAVLATLETREWKTLDNWGRARVLTGLQVRALYDAIPDTMAMCRAVDAQARSDRAFDRAVQILKNAKLVEYRDGAWRRKGDGEP